MNLEKLFEPLLSFTGTFDLKLLLFLYLLCTIGEMAGAVPYLLETVWLLAGYHVGSGTLSPTELLLLWLVSQAGRQTGAAVLYYLSRVGSIPSKRLYRRYFSAGLSERLASSNTLPFRLLRRIGQLSAFSTALARLSGLRIPVTLTLAFKRQPGTLALGVLISSLVWDGVYLALGMLGAKVVLRPAQMLLYSFIGLTVLYVTVFAVRRLLRGRPPRQQKIPVQ